ncbi:MAG: hypothetical protein H6754_00615 [Candidatus Omnitrophica bacterium]|nr:hypothetical protein [Candidatus Omnitrophota bacterium]
MIERDLGPQPLIEVMTRLEITSEALVKSSTAQLSFKMVSKGCKGRRLTLNGQYKILAALHALRPNEKLTLKDLFNY